MMNARTTRSVATTFVLPWSWLAVLGVLSICMVLLYASELKFLLAYFRQPEYSHGYLIPLITGFFLWNRRQAILAERDTGSWWGVALAALALALLAAGLMSLIVRFAVVSFVLMLLAMGYAALGNRAMWRAIVPILFLLTAMPLPGIIFVTLSSELQLLSSQIGGAILSAFGVPVFVGGNIIDLGVYQLQVAEACSGLRYLFPLLTFALLCAWLMRAPLWMRGAMVLSAIPLTVALNSVRIAITGLLVGSGNTKMAEGFMHLFEGWVIFVVALVILFAEMWVMCRLRQPGVSLGDILDFDRIKGSEPATATVPAASTPPLPLLAVLAMVFSTLLVHENLQNRGQYIPPRPGLATFPMTLGEWRGTPALLDAETARVLNATDYLSADFADAAGDEVSLWIAYYDEQVGDSVIHSPQQCLPGAGWEYSEFEVAPAPLDPSISSAFEINRAVIARGSQRMIMYYWLDMRGRKLTSDLLMKLYNLYDSIVMGRSDGALVRLITEVATGETEAEAEARLADFLAHAYPHLAPHIGP
jgi:exosortase D (VPLPA-CTERM-specific)